MNSIVDTKQIAMNNERGFELWVGSAMISEIHLVKRMCVRFILNTHDSRFFDYSAKDYLVAKHYPKQKTLQFKTRDKSKSESTAITLI
jgi:hypothetical protein